jgi:plastocyanin
MTVLHQLVRTWLLNIGLFPLAVLPALLAGCGADSAQSKPDEAAPAPRAAEKEKAPAPAAAERQILIDNFAYDPPKLIVPAGTRVTWVNRDDVPHTATSNTRPKAFSSGTLDTDQKFSHVFTAPGTYDYFCALHPKMTGRIVVK